MTKISLSQAASGDSCLVLGIEPEPPELKSRLYTLGIIPGSLLKVLRFAPLGDPMQLRVGGSFISIRKTEADVISVEVQ